MTTKQLTCAAIDDEPLALELIANYTSQFPALKLLATFEDAVSGAEYLRQNPVDLLFADINMPDITGIDLVKSLDPRPMIIFTTAYKHFAWEGFELQAVDYLLKPIDFGRFRSAIEKAIDFHRYRTSEAPQEQQDSLYVHSEYRLLQIRLDDIEYIEAMEDYIKICLISQPKPVLTLMTLKKVLEKLPADRFSRIHRSYIVAHKYIRSIRNRKVLLRTAELPVGNRYTEAISKLCS